MAGKGVIWNEEAVEKGGTSCCGWCCSGGGVSGSGLDGRSDVADNGRDHDRNGYPGVGCRDLRFPGCSSNGGPIGGGTVGAGVIRAVGGALVVTLALCVGVWADVAWAEPVITGVMPADLSKGGVTDATVVVTGIGIQPGMQVRWLASGVGLETSVSVDGTTAVAVLPVNLLEAAGTGVQGVDVYDASTMVGSNQLWVNVSESMESQLAPILYVAAGLLGAMAFIFGMGQRWS